MGQTDRQPTTSPAMTLGGIPIKSGPLTTCLAALAAAGWTAVGCTLLTGAGARWVVAASCVALALSMATFASKALELLFVMLDRHAQQMREQVLTLNWMMTSGAWAVERAKIDAARFYDGTDQQPWGPGDTGPFTIVNGSG
jgi:hypothetical protein